MPRKACQALAVMALMLGLVACAKPKTGIIRFPTQMSNTKNAPHDNPKQDKKVAAQTHTQLAAVYIKQGRLKEAQETLQEAVKFDDSYIPAHTLLAILNWRIHRFDKADDEFRKAIALDPTKGTTNNNYGKFLCRRGKRQQAMQYFKRALADPFYKTPAVANTNAGTCLLDNKQYAGAQTYLHEALTIDAGYSPALLAMARLDYLKGDAFSARGYMQRFEDAGQATPASLLLGYRIATKLGHRNAATGYLNRLQDKFPDSAQAQSLNGSSQ